MLGQRWWPGHVRERQGHHGALRSVRESRAAEGLRPQLLQLALELHPTVLKPGLDLGKGAGEGENTRLQGRWGSFMSLLGSCRPAPSPAHLHLGEAHPARQLPALGRAQVLLPLEGALQGADLLRAERRAQPPPAAPALLLGHRALGTLFRHGLPRSRRPPACSWGQRQGPKGQPGPGTARGAAPALPPPSSRRAVMPSRARGCPRAAARRPGAPGCPGVAVPAAGVAARSLLLPPVPSRGPAGCSWLRSLRPRLEPEPGRWSPDDARCGEPSVGLWRAWLLWDNHSTEKGALVILPCYGDAGKEISGSTGLSFIPQLPEENVVCVNTHQRAR